MEKLGKIGFYTLTDFRAKNSSTVSPLWRCEILITDRCNFNCPYCRKRYGPDIDKSLAVDIIRSWCKEGLKNIRFSGGEPTLNPFLGEYVTEAKMGGVEHIAISTNGSSSTQLYKDLCYMGVNDFSISLDACCCSTGDIMSGTNGLWNRVVDNIKELAKLTYVTVGIVLTDQNVKEAEKIIQFANDLGVSDIRIIPSAQTSKVLPQLSISDGVLNSHSILRYRIDRSKSCLPIRGIRNSDNPKCPLVLDDMAVDERGNHYPCIIYMRERGKPIGKFNGDMKKVRQERMEWMEKTDCSVDPICSGNCLDVCVDYNNRHRELNRI